MAISKDRMDRFTSQAEDFEIIKPAPKKKSGAKAQTDKPKGKTGARPAKKKK